MILVLGGTSTARGVIENLMDKDFTVTVATEYGEREFRAKYPENVMRVRFTSETLENFIKNKHVTEIIDATHPHAAEITAIAKTAAEKCGIAYTDMVRKTEAAEEDAHVFRGYEQAAAFLKDRSFSRILFTIGSNNIHFFSGLTASSYVRVLPFEKSIEKCVEAGFERSRIIAMQGPFSAEFNAALCRELEIDCLVTKNSGEGSGFREKQVACRTLGISFVVINPPE